MLFRVRFYDDKVKKYITDWALCKAEAFQSLLDIYNGIHSGNIECGFSDECKLKYDVDKLWLEYATTEKNVPVTHGDGKELMKVSSMDITLGDLQENHTKVFIIFHVTEYVKSREETSNSIEVREETPAPKVSTVLVRGLPARGQKCVCPHEICSS